jgi:hypothetical protein
MPPSHDHPEPPVADALAHRDAHHANLPIAITMGDACGIGPEIVLKALAAISAEQAANATHLATHLATRLIVYGDPGLLELDFVGDRGRLSALLGLLGVRERIERRDHRGARGGRLEARSGDRLRRVHEQRGGVDLQQVLLRRISRHLRDLERKGYTIRGGQAHGARRPLGLPGDALPIDQAMADRIVEEANHAFHLNMTMFQELEGNLIAAIGKVLFGFLTRRQRSGSTEVAAA